MTIDRHPNSLKSMIRSQLQSAGWSFHEVSYDAIHSLSDLKLEDIDAVLLAPARYFPPEYMDRLVNCKVFQIWSSGFDKFNIEDALARKIPVSNNNGSNAVSVAEHAILMMLALSRRAPEMHHRVIKGQWAGNDHGMTSYSLDGKTLGIVGLGNIGSLVATRAEAFGMEVLFSDPGVTTSPVESWKKTSFIKLLEKSDYITFHVHLRPDTRGMLRLENLPQLLRKPFIINVSRAELIDYHALIEGLELGTISGIGLDAHYEEPTSSSSRLFQFTNVFFSPHVAGSTRDAYQATIAACVQNIEAALAPDRAGFRALTYE